MTPPAALRDGRLLAEIAYEAKGFVFACFHNVGIAAFADKPSVEVIRALRKVTTEPARKYGCISTIYIAMDGMSLPDATARAVLAEVANEIASSTLAAAQIVLGDGFWSSAMRAFATSVHWVARSPYKMRAFSNVSEAATWIAEQHGMKSIAIDATALEQEISRLLARPSVGAARAG